MFVCMGCAHINSCSPDLTLALISGAAQGLECITVKEEGKGPVNQSISQSATTAPVASKEDARMKRGRKKGDGLLAFASSSP